MSILVNKETRVLIQGITGTQASFHVKRSMDYGTQVVAGVTPGKGGTFEEIGADFYKNLQHKKPVIGFVAGNAVPFGHKMGYAGDIITNGHITVQDKKEAMAAVGMIVVDNINDIHKELAKL